jgi:hypothetical protein
MNCYRNAYELLEDVRHLREDIQLRRPHLANGRLRELEEAAVGDDPERAKLAQADLAMLAHEAAMGRAERCDTALPGDWAQAAWELGLQPIGHVVWSYWGAPIFGRAVGLCPAGRDIVRRVEAALRVEAAMR